MYTRFSVGPLSVTDTIVTAKRAGLSYLGLTDLDTMADPSYAVSAGRRLGITVIPGVEISTWDSDLGLPVQILGLRLPERSPHLRKLCEEMCSQKTERVVRFVRRLNENGHSILMDEVRERVTAGMPPEELQVWPGALFPHHLWSFLNPSEMEPLLRQFDLENELTPAPIETARAVEAIHRDGAVAVLSCPSKPDHLTCAQRLVDLGLEGIEVNHPHLDLQARQRAIEFAADHGLFGTGGSARRVDQKHGYNLGELRSPDQAFEKVTRYDHPDVAWTADLARAAGQMILPTLLRSRDSDRKQNNHRDLVTDVDRKVERYLVESIRQRFPDHQFLAEEEDSMPPDPRGPLWIVDPIDGTTNFVASGGYFAVSVAHYDKGKPMFGVVYDCVADVMYGGIAGRGADRNGVPLRRSVDTPIKEAVIEISSLTMQQLREAGDPGADDPAAIAGKFRAQRAYGCASLGLCRIADGSLDVYLSSSLSIWDYAAAAIVLQEAGGVVGLQDAGADPPWFHRNRGYVLGAAGPELFALAKDRFLASRTGIDLTLPS